MQQLVLDINIQLFELCLSLNTGQGQVSFKVNISSIQFLLSASKNWTSKFDT